MPNFPTILDEWDQQWNEVDSKTHTLKTKVFNLEDEMGVAKTSTRSIEDEITILKGVISALAIREKARTFFDTDKISKPELQRLLSMLDSDDEESRNLAVETIKNI